MYKDKWINIRCTEEQRRDVTEFAEECDMSISQLFWYLVAKEKNEREMICNELSECGEIYKPVNLNAFRKRLYLAGFTKISIYELSNCFFLVSCFDHNNNFYSGFFGDKQMVDAPLSELLKRL